MALWAVEEGKGKCMFCYPASLHFIWHMRYLVRVSEALKYEYRGTLLCCFLLSAYKVTYIYLTLR